MLSIARRVIFMSNLICYATVFMYLNIYKSMSKILPMKRAICQYNFLKKQTDLVAMFNKNRIYPQTVIDNVTNAGISKEEFTNRYSKQYSKLLIVTPGGINGFYMMGIIKYIIERINIDDYIFSGASAGAWCCLFLCLKNPIKFIELMPTILTDLQQVTKSRSLYQILYSLKNTILSITTTSDYNLDRLFIGVLKYENYQLTTTIYTNFTSLEDALDCCISSSHIPFITGEFSYMYHGRCVFDGAFSKYPFVNNYPPSLVIDPTLWKPHTYGLISQARSVSMTNLNIPELFWDGYRDSVINGSVLYDLL
jgi:hypothetical protein